MELQNGTEAQPGDDAPFVRLPLFGAQSLGIVTPAESAGVGEGAKPAPAGPGA